MTRIKRHVTRYLWPSLLLAACLLGLRLAGYIDNQVISRIYLPIWLGGLVISLFGQTIFSGVVVIAAALGLTLEYVAGLLQGPRPTLTPAWLNVACLVLGIIIGLIAQLKANRQAGTHAV